MKTSLALIWHLFSRDFKAEYRQSLLGYLWALIPVLATTLTWVFLDQQNIVSIASTDLPYAIHVMVGTMLWGIFAKSLTGVMQGFSSGSSVFVKIKCSPLAFSLSGLSQVFFDLFLQCLLLIPAFFLFVDLFLDEGFLRGVAFFFLLAVDLLLFALFVFFLDVSSNLCKRVFPSVRLSIGPSITHTGHGRTNGRTDKWTHRFVLLF